MARLKGHEKPMAKIMMLLVDEKLQELDRLSEVTRIPRAVFLREAIDDLLEKYKKELRRRK